MIFNDNFARLFECAGIVYMKSRRAVSRALEPVGITYDQFGTLMALGVSSGMSQRKLATVLETDTTTAMVICEGLEKRGMITRTRDPKDRRTYVLAPTPAGTTAAQKGFTIMAKLYAPLRDSLSLEEVARALPVMEKAAAMARAMVMKKNRRKE
jgi:DNA-binding MarR family transcriptional regulator